MITLEKVIQAQSNLLHETASMLEERYLDWYLEFTKGDKISLTIDHIDTFHNTTLDPKSGMIFHSMSMFIFTR